MRYAAAARRVKAAKAARKAGRAQFEPGWVMRKGKSRKRRRAAPERTSRTVRPSMRDGGSCLLAGGIRPAALRRVAFFQRGGVSVLDPARRVVFLAFHEATLVLGYLLHQSLDPFPRALRVL